MGWRHFQTLKEAYHFFGSEPTVWDGDFYQVVIALLNVQISSEPTVWDGDSVITSLAFSWLILLVLSPPCGMETRSFLGLSTAASGF